MHVPIIGDANLHAPENAINFEDGFVVQIRFAEIQFHATKDGDGFPAPEVLSAVLTDTSSEDCDGVQRVGICRVSRKLPAKFLGCSGLDPINLRLPHAISTSLERSPYEQYSDGNDCKWPEFPECKANQPQRIQL